jgi:hypothetical protein
LTELRDEFEKEGLVVIALSDEKPELISDYIDKHGLTVAIAAEAKTSKYRVKGIPAACLVDAEGKVVWFGDPRGLSKGKVKSALKGAKKPGKGGFLSMNLQGEYDGGLKKAAASAEKGDLGKALSATRKLLTDEDFGERSLAEELEAEITAYVSLLQSQADTFLASREVVTAVKIFDALAGTLKGLDESKPAKEALDKIEQDDGLQDELKAAELLAKANDSVERLGKKKSVKKFEAVVKKFPDTKAGERAKKFLKTL